MSRIAVVSLVLTSLTTLPRYAVAAEPTSRDFAKQIDSVPAEMRRLKDPLTAIGDKSPAVRYFAIASLDVSKSKDHEQALVAALEDEVRWLRYTAAVKLADAELHAEQISPVLVEALGGDEYTYASWGTRQAIQSIYKVGAPSLPHLSIAVDSPNTLLRKNGCYVLGQMPGIVKDRKHYQKPLAALDAAIVGNKYPASRPMYVVTRMKIDGDIDRAEKLLREDAAQSKNIEVRVAAIGQTKHLRSNGDRMVPLLIKALTDDEPRIIRAATNALWSLHRVGNVDVSAAIPVIASQVEKKLEPYHLHDRLVRFLDDRWEELGETPEDNLPEAHVIVKNFPVKKAAFRSYVMQRLDRGLGIDGGIAASWVMKAHGAAGMAIIDIEFAGRSPAGKVLLMKAMQHLPYIESYELLLKAMADQETVKWNIPQGTKGGAPPPPGSIRLRVCDEAFKYLRWRLRDWKPLSTAVGRRSMYPGAKIAERDELIATMKKVWEKRGKELLLPSYKMAQTGGSEQSLKAGELKQVRQSVLDADVVTGTKPDISGVPRKHLIVPETLIAAYRKDPVGVLQVLRSILKDGTAVNARKAWSFANGLRHPTFGSTAAATQPAAYDQPIEQGGKTRRWIRIRQLENQIVAAAARRMRPNFELIFLGYAADKAFVPLKLKQLPETLQASVMGRSLNLFQKAALPFAYNSGLYEPVPKARDSDATIRVLAAQTKGDKDLIELSWRVDDTDVKWVMGQNICCLMIPTATFDSSQKFKTFLEKVYRMKGEPNWYQAYTIELPWPETLRDGVEISSNINKHPAMDVFVWPLRVDLVVKKGVAYVLTYHRNPQLPGFEPGDAYFSDEFRKNLRERQTQ